MRPRHPVTLFRPMHTSNDDGTFSESLVITRVGTIYVISIVHEAQTSFIVDTNTDVRVGDLITADAANYRVTGISRVLGAPHKVLTLERRSKPIVPGVTEVGS